MKIWQCKIGEIEELPNMNGPDYPMRRAVAQVYRELTGQEPKFIFSDWGAELSEPERAVVEGRLPNKPAMTDAERLAYEKGQREMRERAVHEAQHTPFRAHSDNDIDYRSGCEQTQWRIASAIAVLPILSADKEKS